MSFRNLKKPIMLVTVVDKKSWSLFEMLVMYIAEVMNIY
jgi:hypothetical protein